MNRCASRAAANGLGDIRIAASEPSTWDWPQAIKTNGSALPSSADNAMNHQMRPHGGRRSFSQTIMPAIRIVVIASRVMVIGIAGTVETAILMKVKLTPQMMPSTVSRA